MSRAKSGSALEKALVVLEALVAKPRPTGLAYLSDELPFPKPTVHRVLQQLEGAGLIQRTPDTDRYWIGPRLNALAVGTLGSQNRPLSLRAILEQLVEELGETCSVGILDQHEVVYVERVECNFPLRFALTVGSHVPAHCTAIGKLLLAYVPPERQKRFLVTVPLKRYSDNTIVDVEKFTWELTKIRQQGYSTNDQEYVPGLIAVAVPITRSDGTVVAGLSVHAPALRLDLQTAISYLPPLQSAATRLAASLGIAQEHPANR